ncbi:MAG TPA: serine hydrolase domain-containing protein [Myxococcota bacterium]|nr:serine hydrolase domain-containing protein [Myxococcota bacterium]HRY92885.1 serine hydrolase domain-containing protein [Myxococcota bacterium]HSA21521.1 serine hydrolase domain-containing protein [Myxococcota bacterium]
MAHPPEPGALMDEAVRQGIFPGGVLHAERAGRPRWRSAHGRSALDPQGPAVGPETVYDLASLTKPLAAASVALQAVERGALELDAPAGRWLPELPGAAAALTPWHLLAHASGLPAWRPLHLELAPGQAGTAAGQAALRARAAREPLEAPPGARVEYSDLGFVLLEWLLERALGLPFADAFHSLVAAPLGLTELFFVDLKDPTAAARARAGRVFAATERCPWRGRVLSGEVHDENAWAAGGVAGQAGLFGTAAAVARVGRAWLDALAGRGGPFDAGLARRFCRRTELPGPVRTLGFDTPAPVGSQAGSRLGPRAFGHLGFTGTSLWLEPERELVVVLLTNRVHPRREDDRLRAFRPGLHDALVDWLERGGGGEEAA